MFWLFYLQRNFPFYQFIRRLRGPHMAMKKSVPFRNWIKKKKTCSLVVSSIPAPLALVKKKKM
jgi:hypothetical protein